MPSLKSEALAAIDSAESQEKVADLLSAFKKWDTAREFKKAEAKRLNASVEKHLVSLKEAMEVGHSTQADQLMKLSVVEARWQELDEARTERKEILGAAKDALSAAETEIRELISNANQLNLFARAAAGAGVTTANDEEDDDEEAAEDTE